jgi:SAM-dependent methyltransferase
VRKIYEPACGTGRLLIKLAQAGYRVSGGDLNPKAVAFCNQRLIRYKFPANVRVEDMADFKVAKPYDAAFNTINTFRHLPNEATAEAHLKCMADAIAKGGLYLLGLHLTPRGTPECVEESWSARRGNLQVNSYMKIVEHDKRRRMERTAMRFDIYTPSQQFRLQDELLFRTYTLPQFSDLLKRVPQWQCVETFDFAYDIDSPIKLDNQSEDVVFVLRRK